MMARWYLLYRREPRSIDWEDGVFIYEKLYPKQVRRLVKQGWRIRGNPQGDRIN